MERGVTLASPHIRTTPKQKYMYQDVDGRLGNPQLELASSNGLLLTGTDPRLSTGQGSSARGTIFGFSIHMQCAFDFDLEPILGHMP